MSIHRWFSATVIILLMGAALRFHLQTQDARFHPDEALFSTFARSAAVHGDWMLAGPLDKSPASIYLSALSMHFTATHTNTFGVLDMTVQQGEFAARLPNIYLSLILVALTAAISRSVAPHSEKPALFAAVLMASSPYVLVFAASAFTDMAMVTFGAAALVASLRGRAVTSGLLLALSIASKQQSIVYLPLVLMLAHYANHLTRDRLVRWLLAFATGIALLLLWDLARPGTSILALASANNNPKRVFASPGEWLPRLWTWLDYTSWLLGPPVLTLPLVGLSAVYALWTRRKIDLILWGYVLAYFALHWIVAFNTYDRYLLPLAPVMAVLVSRGLMWPITARQMPRRVMAGLLSVLLIVGLYGAFITSRWQVDLGRDHYPLDEAGEIIALADYLNEQPLGTIIYDPWMGWEMGYYLGAWSNKRRVHYPTPEALVNDAVSNPEAASRYLIAPKSQPVTVWLDALRAADFAVSTDYETGNYIVYRLIRP